MNITINILCSTCKCCGCVHVLCLASLCSRSTHCEPFSVVVISHSLSHSLSLSISPLPLKCLGVCRPASNPLPRDKCEKCNKRRAGVHDNGCRDQASTGSRQRSRHTRWQHSSHHTLLYAATARKERKGLLLGHRDFFFFFFFRLAWHPGAKSLCSLHLIIIY